MELLGVAFEKSNDAMMQMARNFGYTDFAVGGKSTSRSDGSIGTLEGPRALQPPQPTPLDRMSGESPLDYFHRCVEESKFWSTRVSIAGDAVEGPIYVRNKDGILCDAAWIAKKKLRTREGRSGLHALL